MIKKTLCPSCKKESDLSVSNLYRPFCTERCRLIDLGQWVEEAYTISEPALADDYNTDYSESPQKH